MKFFLHSHDENLLKELTKSTGIGDEQVTALQRRANMNEAMRKGAPYVLIFGNLVATEQLLISLLGKNQAQEVLFSKAPVVVIGNNPHNIKPLLTSWPCFKSNNIPFDGIILLKQVDIIPEATLAALASLGTIELGIMTTRLSQAFNQNERILCQALSGIVENLRVALVGHPQEEVSIEDVAELTHYVSSHAKQAGFAKERMNSSCIWFHDEKSRGLPSEVTSANELISIEGVNSQKDAALITSLRFLIENIESKLVIQPKKIGLVASEEDLDRLINQFESHIQKLGKSMQELVETGDIRTSEQAQTFLVDKMQSWIVGNSLQANSLSLADKFCPGVKAQLLSSARDVAHNLIVELPPEQPKAIFNGVFNQAAIMFLVENQKVKLLTALGIGSMAIFVSSIPLLFLADDWAAKLGMVGVGILSGVFVYLLPDIIKSLNKNNVLSKNTKKSLNPSLKCWSVVEGQLSVAFSQYMRNDTGDTIQKSLTELKERLVK